MKRCVECGRAGVPLVDVEGGAICRRCVRELLGGAIPDRISCGGPSPVYWWWCVCGLQVRRGPYQVDLAVVVAEWTGTEKGLDKELDRIQDYRAKVEGIPSGGVMLCRRCAAAAGVPLLAPAALRAGGA